VARITQDSERLIGLRDVKWYDGWPTAPSAEEKAPAGPGGPASPDQVTDAQALASPDPEP